MLVQAESRQSNNIFIAPPAGRLVTVQFIFLALYLFMLASRVQDYISSLHVPAVVLACCLIASMISTESLFGTMVSRGGRLLLMFTGWMIVCVVFSVWRGGAAESFLHDWLQVGMIFLVTATLTTTVRQVTAAMAIFAAGVVVGAATALLSGGAEAGRLIIDNGSRFADPNDLAQFALICLCFTGGVVTARGMKAWKVVLYPGACIALVSLLRTGSRGGFVAMIVVLAVLLFTGSVENKFVLVVSGLVVVVIGLVVMPQALRVRYLYVFGVDDQPKESLEQTDAAGRSSAQARRYLFWRSVTITLQHPVTGVGPGMFAVAENQIAKSQGRARGLWHVTHNMFTQVSSEEGIVGLLLWAGALVAAFRALGAVCRLKKQTQDPASVEAAKLANWLRAALVAFVVTGTFLSSAYSELFFVLIGLSVALQKAVQPMTMRQVTVAPAPAWAVPQRAAITSKAAGKS
ncbi:MAG TPA: O-antigen ligase family protein [Bryobacteraceae bacterium]|nr:O-antigen ligase family protein [Bryobacteraceae bacterium]